MGRLLAEDGSELATVEVESDLAGGKLALSVSSGKGQLLDYYFQRGRRAVTIDRAGRLDRGRLHISAVCIGVAERLIADFQRDIERWNHENRDT